MKGNGESVNGTPLKQIMNRFHSNGNSLSFKSV